MFCVLEAGTQDDAVSFVEHVQSIYHDATRTVFGIRICIPSCLLCCLVCLFHYTQSIPYSNASIHASLSLLHTFVF